MRSITIDEVGSSGFGDRLRGLALGSFLCRFHRVDTLFYNDTENLLDETSRYQNFPYELPELVRFKHINFVKTPLPFDQQTLKITHNSAGGSVLKSQGFKDFRHLEPCSQRVNEIVNAIIPNDKKMLGFHIRGTDAKAFRRGNNEALLEKRAIIKLLYYSKKMGIGSVFVASDNAQDRAYWQKKLEILSFDVKQNDYAIFTEADLRQTNADNMLIDFFCLAKCKKIIRFTPSEFSRFATWCGGEFLGAHSDFKKDKQSGVYI